MNLDTITSVPVGSITLLTLFHFLWQASLIAAVVCAAQLMIGPRQLGLRYCVSIAALLLMAVAPIATAIYYVDNPDALQAWRIHPASQFGSASTLALAADEPFAYSPPTSPADRTGKLAGLTYFATCLFNWLDSSRHVWIGIWVAGIGLLSLRLVAGFVACWKLRITARRLPKQFHHLADRLKHRMGVSSRVVVMASEQVGQALAVGIIKPVVLIPASWFSHMPVVAVEAIIAHELAHIRRLDLWFNGVQRIVETLFFFHPAVWWLSRRISQDREVCCDQVAIGVTGNRFAYAETLAKVAETRFGSDDAYQFGATFIGGKKMNLLRRVRLALEHQSTTNQGRMFSLSAVACVTALIGFVLAIWSHSFTSTAAAAPAVALAIADEGTGISHQGAEQDELGVWWTTDRGRELSWVDFMADGNMAYDAATDLAFTVLAQPIQDRAAENVDRDELVRQLRELADELDNNKAAMPETKKGQAIVEFDLGRDVELSWKPERALAVAEVEFAADPNSVAKRRVEILPRIAWLSRQSIDKQDANDVSQKTKDALTEAARALILVAQDENESKRDKKAREEIAKAVNAIILTQQAENNSENKNRESARISNDLRKLVLELQKEVRRLRQEVRKLRAGTGERPAANEDNDDSARKSKRHEAWFEARLSDDAASPSGKWSDRQRSPKWIEGKAHFELHFDDEIQRWIKKEGKQGVYWFEFPLMDENSDDADDEIPDRSKDQKWWFEWKFDGQSDQPQVDKASMSKQYAYQIGEPDRFVDVMGNGSDLLIKNPGDVSDNKPRR